MLIEENTMLSALKIGRIFPNVNLNNQLTRLISKKVNLQNVVTLYQLAKKFGIKTLAEENFKYIERCFITVSESHNFLHLDFRFLVILLSSSQLHITSEIEVMKAANAWISYDYHRRSKFAKSLLLTVRLPLLSESVLKKCFTQFLQYT